MPIPAWLSTILPYIGAGSQIASGYFSSQAIQRYLEPLLQSFQENLGFGTPLYGDILTAIRGTQPPLQAFLTSGGMGETDWSLVDAFTREIGKAEEAYRQSGITPEIASVLDPLASLAAAPVLFEAQNVAEEALRTRGYTAPILTGIDRAMELGAGTAGVQAGLGNLASTMASMGTGPMVEALTGGAITGVATGGRTPELNQALALALETAANQGMPAGSGISPLLMAGANLMASPFSITPVEQALLARELAARQARGAAQAALRSARARGSLGPGIVAAGSSTAQEAALLGNVLEASQAAFQSALLDSLRAELMGRQIGANIMEQALQEAGRRFTSSLGLVPGTQSAATGLLTALGQLGLGAQNVGMRGLSSATEALLGVGTLQTQGLSTMADLERLAASRLQGLTGLGFGGVGAQQSIFGDVLRGVMGARGQQLDLATRQAQANLQALGAIGDIITRGKQTALEAARQLLGGADVATRGMVSLRTSFPGFPQWPPTSPWSNVFAGLSGAIGSYGISGSNNNNKQAGGNG